VFTAAPAIAAAPIRASLAALTRRTIPAASIPLLCTLLFSHVYPIPVSPAAFKNAAVAASPLSLISQPRY
jgi:hypothetical protein